MELYYSFSVFIVLAAVFSFINVRYLKLPSTIGIMSIAMFITAILSFLSSYYPEPFNDIDNLIHGVDFTSLLMGAMLNFLLFAGAIHINISDLKEQRLSIILLSTLGVVISTLLVGFGLYYITNFLLPSCGITIIELPLIYCLTFGALISPTDPIAVLSLLKYSNASKSLQTKIAGESLFNDGVAVVLFAILYNLLSNKDAVSGTIDISFLHVLKLFVLEGGGGLLLGSVLGYIGIWAIKRANDYKVSVLITLAVVMGGYLVAQSLHVSAPLAMVVAGLWVGEFKRRKKEHTDVVVFWDLVDDIMNAILFLYMGFEILLYKQLKDYWFLGIICIVLVLIARYLSIRIPTLLPKIRNDFPKSTIAVMVWGGLRGGVSIALVLSMPNNEYKPLIVSATYFVVVFSIIVQGLTVGKLVKKLS